MRDEARLGLQPTVRPAHIRGLTIRIRSACVKDTFGGLGTGLGIVRVDALQSSVGSTDPT